MRTAECVTPKHPDKVCDRVSDAVLDACLEQDPQSRVAVESMGGHGHFVMMGEVTSKANIDYNMIARMVIGDGLQIESYIATQSDYIAQGVDTGGAGDQGIMVGYACNETPELMPVEVMRARQLAQFLYAQFPYDGKTQITYEENTKKITAVVASFQNAPKEKLTGLVAEWLMKIPEQSDGVSIFCNPAGDWSQGSFDADTGLTGRKIAVDSYGPRIPVGGGAFSGKDATKVDRSAAYMARRIAVDLLRQRNAQEVYVHLAYSIGVAEPVHVSAMIDGVEETITGYDVRPQSIIEYLKLRQPQFSKTAEWGHFGNGFTWDK
jgi:S-adenosylmethionine synthetase